MYLEAESLYHRATKLFMGESWTELAAYSLLQQAFCQQVQWRTETIDNVETSVFRRWVFMFSFFHVFNVAKIFLTQN